MKLSILSILFLILIAVAYSANLGAVGNIVNGTNYHTVVVGGGIAGITAAVKIAKSGKNVAVIEANSYIGGRLKTTSVSLSNGNTLKFDQGASWIHGKSVQNPITNLSQTVSGLQGIVTTFDNFQIFNQDGTSADTEVGTAYTTYKQLLQDAESYQTTDSIQSVFQAENPSVLTNKYFMFNVGYDMEFQYAAPISSVSAKAQHDDNFPGDQFLILSGYQRFPQTLAQSVNMNIFLNSKVVSITKRDQDNLITCQNGDYVTATHVVIAVPLGVLKAGAITFSPALPASKTAAISGLGFGNVCKILISFNSGTNFVFPQSHYIGVVSNDVTERGIATYFLNLKFLANVPALMTFGLGLSADSIESMAQADLKTILADRLSIFSSTAVTASDFTISRSSWRSNTNIRGAYSYSSTTTASTHYDDMMQAVTENHWHFCGEHTISQYRGTVHGAYLSGQRAAMEITGMPNFGIFVKYWGFNGILLLLVMIIFNSI